MNPTQTLWRNSMNYGLIAGLILIVYALILYFLDMMFYKPFLVGQLPGIIVLLVFMMIGTKALRDQFMHGSITYGKAFLSAFLIGLIAMVLALIFSDILTYVIDPGLKEKALQFQAEKMLSSGKLTQEQIDTMLERQKEMSGKVWVIAIGQFFILLTDTVIAAVIALITAAIQKKEGDPFADAVAEVTENTQQ